MPQDFDALRTLSAEVGADPLLVQAAGGNTSLKDGAIMRIKASGTWLMQALEAEIFVPVDLARLRAALANGDPDSETPHVFTAPDNASGLRPSIETTVHALMPQRVVVHVHCVATIAWAVRADAEAALAAPLSGLHWAFVPYARPGLPLARAIQARIKPETDVLVLGNHGLVVAAETVADASALLRNVQARLQQPARAISRADLPGLTAKLAGSPYRPAPSARIHDLACDPLSLAVARRGTLYPDHIVFLGPGLRVVEHGAALPADQPRMLVLPGLGVALHHEANPAAQAMALCLADVAARIDPGTALRVLSAEEEHELTHWDAEKYRQALPRQTAAASSADLMRG